MPINYPEQELFNYCHSRALSALKVALVSSDGTQMVTIPIASPDASVVRISSMGGTIGLSTDASGNRVSCVQADAGICRISALGTFSFSTDASNNRVSAMQQDAGSLHVSAFIDSGSVSAKSDDAAFLRVSAFNNDANLFHVSAIGTLAVSSHEVKQSDAGSLRVSAIIDSGSISAMQGDAGNLRMSAFVSLPAIVWSGRTTIASSSANTQLGSASLYQGVIIKAISANLSACYVGNSAVGPANYHYELEPGEATAIAVNNLSCAYLAVIANNDGVQYIGS